MEERPLQEVKGLQVDSHQEARLADSQVVLEHLHSPPLVVVVVVVVSDRAIQMQFSSK